MPLRHVIVFALALASDGLIAAPPVPMPTGTATPIGSLPLTFTGSTSGAANQVSSVASSACAQVTNVPGGEAVYTWLAGPTSSGGIGMHVDFHLTPESGFDAVMYVLTTEGDGTSCVVAADTQGAGGLEYIHMEEILVSGQRYYVYVDSRTSGGGNYSLRASNKFIGVELQTFSID